MSDSSVHTALVAALLVLVALAAAAPLGAADAVNADMDPALLAAGPATSKQSYDHQTTTYNSQFEPVNKTNADVDLTLFFSPDSSAKLLTDLIEEAESTLDIGTPSWNSWSNCTQFSGPKGCAFQMLKDNEAFPVFQATLRAIYRGVTVRILSNNFDDPPAPGMVTPLTFLEVAGAQVRYYKSTSFMHAKYIQVDGRKASVSSVNYSFTSFMNNREAGIIISGDDAGDLLSYLTKVYDYDFNNGGRFPLQSYNESDVAIAQKKAYVDITIPEPRYHYGAYVTTPYYYAGTPSGVGIVASPDYAYDTVTKGFADAQETIDIYIYQITGGGFCDNLCSAARRGVDVTLLASDHIFSRTDYEDAQQCYDQMLECGVTIYKTGSAIYSYNHQKFWIVDKRYSYVSTGNMGSTDYPNASTFPPYGESGWIKTNRDFTVTVDDYTFASHLYKVMEEDLSRGFKYSG